MFVWQTLQRHVHQVLSYIRNTWHVYYSLNVINTKFLNTPCVAAAFSLLYSSLIPSMPDDIAVRICASKHLTAWHVYQSVQHSVHSSFFDLLEQHFFQQQPLLLFFILFCCFSFIFDALRNLIQETGGKHFPIKCHSFNLSTSSPLASLRVYLLPLVAPQPNHLIILCRIVVIRVFIKVLCCQ